MSAFNGAHSVRGGYNQSGGAYFVCVSPLSGSAGTGTDAVTAAAPLSGNANATHLYRISVAASKSGGAFEPATLALVSARDVFGAGNWSGVEATAEVAAGKLIRDMGKTIVSGGRTFRKFAVAPTGAGFVGSLGVAGDVATAPGAGYATFYLDVGREGATGGTLPAPIARYF